MRSKSANRWRWLGWSTRIAALLVTLLLAALMVLDWRGTGVSWHVHKSGTYVQWGYGGCVVVLVRQQIRTSELPLQSSTIENAPPDLPRYPYFNPSTGMDFGWWCFVLFKGGFTIPTWFAVLAAAIPTALLWRSWWRHRNRGPHCCQSCNYSLIGLAPDSLCPECGTAKHQSRGA